MTAVVLRLTAHTKRSLFQPLTRVRLKPNVAPGLLSPHEGTVVHRDGRGVTVRHDDGRLLAWVESELDAI